MAAVTTGTYHTCARQALGTVWCWGDNSYGELGLQAVDRSLVPVQVTGLPGAVTLVQVGEQFTCARRNDGSVWCWGQGEDGQLGDGSTGATSTPTLSQMSRALGVTTGDWHTCSRTRAQRAKCWGANNAGQLGNGTTDDWATPVSVAGLCHVKTLSAGGQHTCAVRLDGTMRCWGDNGFGQLGNGTTVDSPVPSAVVR